MAAQPPAHVLAKYSLEVQRFVQLFVGAWVLAAAHLRRIPRLGISSWYRDPLHNASVGGKQDSQHIIGTAMDLVGEDSSLVAQLFQALGGVHVPEGDHEHVQLFPRGVGPRWT